MSTMNITIIIPALQLPNSIKSTDSPQPTTTPFPPINISPSPTPTLSTMSSYTPARMLIANVDTSSVSETMVNNNNNDKPKDFAVVCQDSPNDEDDYEDYEDYEDDPFLPTSTTPTSSELLVPEESLPPPSSETQLIAADENDHQDDDNSVENNTPDVDVDEEELQRIQNSALSSENSDAVSMDTVQTESISSPDTIIHVLKTSGSPDIESNEAEERPLSTVSCSSQTNFDDQDSESIEMESKQPPDEEEEKVEEKEEKVEVELESRLLDTASSSEVDEEEETPPISSSNTLRPALQRQSLIVVAETEEMTEDRNNGEESQEQEQKTPTPPPSRPIVNDSKSEDQEVIEESLTSAVHALNLNAPTPPSIITTPASAQGERTEHEVLKSLEEMIIVDDQVEHKPQLDKTTTMNSSKKSEQSKAPVEQPPTQNKPKKRLKSVRKVKSKAFPNPRKPSNYPQRTNKVTLARQALAREKRRVYVEERIQSYIKNAQAHHAPSLPSTSSFHHHTHNHHQTHHHHTNHNSNSNNSSFVESSSTKENSHREKRCTSNTSVKHNNTSNHSHSHSHIDTIDDDDLDLDDHFTSLSTSSLANSTFGAIPPPPKLNELQSQLQENHGSSHTSLPHIIDSKNYYLNNPMSLPTPPLKNLNAMSPGVARVHSHRRVPFKSTQVSSYHQSMTLPLMGSSSAPQISYHSGSETVKHSIYAVPSTTPNESDSQQQSSSSQKSWKGVEHHGYFYSFRVRQSGPVQMMDKSVQTGTTTTPEPQPQSYTLSFLETHSQSDSYIICTNTTTTTTTSETKTTPPTAKNNNQDENSAANNINDEPSDDRDKILREIAETVQLRHDAELRRADLVQRANDLQTRVKEKRDKINRRHEFWHKKYIEESSLTRPLEASCSSLRAELNTVHRRLLAHLEGRDLPLRLRDGPSKKANYKIMAARLQHEIKELQQKVKSAKLKLESEVKLKEQADREVREIRNDLSHKKVVMSLARSQVSTLPAVHARSYDSLVY